MHDAGADLAAHGKPAESGGITADATGVPFEGDVGLLRDEWVQVGSKVAIVAKSFSAEQPLISSGASAAAKRCGKSGPVHRPW
jgi:hypothetical protein